MKQKLIGYFRLTRVTDFFAQTLVTVAVVATFAKGLVNPFLFLYLFFANLILTAFSFAINDVEDAPDDAKDTKKAKRNPISAKLLSRKEGIVFTFILAIASMALLWPLGQIARIIALFDLAIGFLYSYKPVRLKSIPIADLASHGLFLGVFQLTIAAIGFGITFDIRFYLTLIIAFSFSVLSDLYSEVRDYEIDRKTNIKNTASVINIDLIKSKTHYFHVLPAIAMTLILLTNFHGAYRLYIILGGLSVAVFYLFSSEKTRYKLVHYHFKYLLVGISTVLIGVHTLQSK